MSSNHLISQIIKSICRHGDRNAFFIQGQHFTYNELAERICGNLKAIQEFQTDKKQCIGIVEKDDIATYASLLAVLISGNTYVILNPHNPDSRNQNIVYSTGIELILQSDISYKFLHDRTEVKTICTQNLSSENILKDIKALPSEEDLAYIIFTSGSTGVPKGVPISHKNLNAFYDAYSALGFELDHTDRMLQMFDLCFDVSVVSTLYPLSLGACVYTVPQDGVKYTYVYELLEDEELTFATIAPSLLSYLQPYFDEIDLPKLKYLVLTAEASNWETLKQFLPCTPIAEYVNLYGPTEGTIYCTAYRVNPENVKTYNGMLAIGSGFKNMHTTIIGEDYNPVKRGEKGELCIAGLQLMNGYWKNPEKSKEVFTELEYMGVPIKYYKTGDICFEDEKGCIHYCGRKDYQVQIQGFRVELNEIEHTVRQYHSKGANVVVAKENQLGNQELHLFLEKYNGEVQSLQNFIKENLPSYMCPQKVHNLLELPLNTSGKVDRKQLIKLI